MFIKAFTLATLCAYLATTSAEGVNCKGSGACPIFHADNSDVGVSRQIQSSIWSIPDSRVYSNGQHIACVPGYYVITIPPKNIEVQVHGGICAFLQKSPNKNSRDLKFLVDLLVQHGCKACGSQPVEPAQNDVNTGMLTLNFVEGEGCNGVC